MLSIEEKERTRFVISPPRKYQFNGLFVWIRIKLRFPFADPFFNRFRIGIEFRCRQDMICYYRK